MLPTGTITFLLTDVEGSTRLWEEHPDLMGAAIERHNALISAAVSEGGFILRSKGEGDSTFSVFADAVDALSAAVKAQRALRSEQWPEGIEVRVRAALYTGDSELRDGDYFGTAPNRAARLRGVVHGGQTVCSQATEALVSGRCPPDVSLLDLGLHRLRDLARAERVFQVGHPELPGDFPPLRSLGVRHNLPEQRTTFVGRDDDLIAVEKHLQTHRLVTLTGVGGCGKTRLAIEVGSGQLDRFGDGIFFCDLSPVSDAHVVPSTVAAAVGFSQLALGTGSGRPSSELIDFLITREVLLVVDNCEHVIDACAELLDEILERCPRVSVLATSREALQLQGEQVYQLAPLGVPDGDFPEVSDSVRLFVDRAQAARPDFVISSDNASDAAEICRRLDGIPLAIELAAARVSHLSPRQIVERLDDRFRLLTGGRRRVRRQQTLHAALDWSYELLPEGQRATLRRLAAFPGSFSYAAADAVCDDVPDFDLLRPLVEKSLVVAEESGTELRYRLLETVRVYAERKLVEAAEDALARDLHRDYFLTWAESIPPEFTYLDPEGIIKSERHNLRAALRWSQQQGRLDLIARLASTMNSLWISDVREGRRWLALGVEASEELDAEHRVRLLAVAAHVAVLAMQAQDGELARRAVEASEESTGMWPALAHGLLALNVSARFFMSRNPVFEHEAEDLGSKAVQVATDDTGRALARLFRGQARVMLGDLDGAIEDLGRASIEVAPVADMSVASLAMMAGALHITGRHDEAWTAAQNVLERMKSRSTAGLWAWALYCLLPYALELGRQGRHAEALTYMRDLLVERETPRTPGVMTSVVLVLGALAVQRDDAEVAGTLLEYVGRALLRDGIRTPVDVALFFHYAQKMSALIDEAMRSRYRAQAGEMSVEDAIALGLRG